MYQTHPPSRYKDVQYMRIEWETGWLEMDYQEVLRLSKDRGERKRYNKLMKLAKQYGWTLVTRKVWKG